MVELLPAQTGEFPVADTGSLGVVATVIIEFKQFEEQVPFSALTKQFVVVEGETLIDTPVPAGVPPHEPEYHCQVAPGERVPVKVRVDDKAEHNEAGEALEEAGAEGVGFTFTSVLLQFEKQLPFSARTK